MARKRCCRISVTFLSVILFCCIKSMDMAYIARTTSQVNALLNSYPKHMNRTMELRFLEDVHDSEVGLCLNLSNAKNKTTVVQTPLVALHVRRTNYSSVTNAFFQFPCNACSIPGPTSVQFVLGNVTSRNISCLTSSCFVDYFGTVDLSRARISDVFSLSLYDPNYSEKVNLNKGDEIQLQIPLAKTPNSTYNYVLECLSQENSTSRWSNASCTTNQTIAKYGNAMFVQCRCSTLGYFTVFVKCANGSVNGTHNSTSNGTPYSGNNCTLLGLLNGVPYGKLNGISGNGNGNGGSSPKLPVIPNCQMSIKLDVDCLLYLSNSTTKADFLNITTYTIAEALNTSIVNIQNMQTKCGSIVVNFTLISPDGTNGTLYNTVLKFANLVTTDAFKVEMNGAKIYPFSMRTYGFPCLGNKTFISPYFYRKFATKPTTPAPEIEPLTVNYEPLIIAVVVVLALVVMCVCCTCCSHSWYLHKKKYTEFNSDKAVPKVEEPIVEEVDEEEEDVAPPEFPMTFTERPQVDERQMARYDWARTSFAVEQSEGSAFVTDQAGRGPRLIMDCDSDDDSVSVAPSVGASVSINMGSESQDEFVAEDGDGGSMDDEELYNTGSVSVRSDETSKEASRNGGFQADLVHEEDGDVPREDKGHTGEVEDHARREDEGYTGEVEEHAGQEDERIEEEGGGVGGEGEGHEGTQNHKDDAAGDNEEPKDDEGNGEQDDGRQEGPRENQSRRSSARSETNVSAVAQGMPEPNM